MAKKPFFDFKLGQSPRLREKEQWLQVAQDTRALGAAQLENARILNLEHVEPGPWQVRRGFHADKMAELVESIREQGVLEPILVRAAEGGRYQIVAGERRYRAAKEAGLETIPAMVLELDDVNTRVVSLMENIQRDDLNEVERAEGLVALKHLTTQTWEEIGHLLGITKRHVLHLVSLTRLPDAVQDMVREGRISAKHGRLLAYVKDPEVQMALAQIIADRHLNARQTAEVVKQIGSEPGFTSSEGSLADVQEQVTEWVASLLSAPVSPVVPAPEVGAVTAGDIRQLMEAVNEVRRAVAAFPPGLVEEDAARRIHIELPALIQAAEALLARIPIPPPAD